MDFPSPAEALYASEIHKLTRRLVIHNSSSQGQRVCARRYGREHTLFYIRNYKGETFVDFMRNTRDHPAVRACEAGLRLSAGHPGEHVRVPIAEAVEVVMAVADTWSS